MKIHLTIHSQKRVIKTVLPDELVYGLKINSKIALQDCGSDIQGQLAPGTITIRGFSGIDGKATRHDVIKIINQALYSRPNKRPKKYRPNIVDQRVAVLDCIFREAKKAPHP